MYKISEESSVLIKNPTSEKLDIIILAGQSNMEGFGCGPAHLEWIPNEKILMMNGEFSTHVEKYIVVEPAPEYSIGVADERYSKDYRAKTGVFALEFARRYAESRLAPDRKLLLVQSAVGGTGFVGGHWGESDILYKRMLEMVDAALLMNSENRVVGMLWHQGEHDAYEQRGADAEQILSSYEKNISTLINGARNRYGKDMPIVAAGFTHGWLDEYPVECKAVLSAMKKVFSELGRCILVENTEDLKSNADVIGGEDTVHFSKIACYELGARYFEAFEQII